MVIKSRICAVSGIFVLSMLTAYCFGAAEPRNPQTPDPKVTETAVRVQQSLDTILTEVDRGLKPTAEMIANGQKMLEESRRYFSQMDDKQKAHYCLLQSWSAYYANEIDAAYLNAAKACKLDATSGDAWASQVAMSLLTNKRPMMPRMPKPVRTSRNRQNESEAALAATQIQKGKLDFDVNLFLAEAVGKKIGPLQLHCSNGTTLDYQPGNEGVCVLFWRKFEAKTTVVTMDPNGRPVPQAPAPVRPMFEGEMMGMNNQSMEGTPQGAFSKLFQAGISSGRMKFAAANIDSSVDKKAIEEEIIKQPQSWAQIIIADQVEGLFSEFDSISPDRPVLMITDTTGTIRYAGPATGFIAPMLLEAIISGNTDMTKGETEIELAAAITPADSNSLTPADSNSLPQAAVPAIPKPVQQQAGQLQSQYKELSEEDSIQAEKLVTYAEDLFMKAAGKHVITYKRGVELCRQVMKDYPGSEYAERARQLLRQIPENQRSRYGITDEELGL